jgi:H+/Cl- antiporter ClcA
VKNFANPRFWLSWLVLCLCCGAAGALFIGSLTAVTRLSSSQPWLLFFLPLSGVAVHALYRWDHKLTSADELSASGGGVSLAWILRGGSLRLRASLAPLIFFGTLLTHLCGGSAGREGTALQMGGGISAALARGWDDVLGRRLLTACGMAGCFAAVFGTPWAAAVFCWELTRWSSELRKGLPLFLITAFSADAICHGLGAKHTDFASLIPSVSLPWTSPNWWGTCVLLMAICAAAVWIFDFAMSAWKRLLTLGLKRTWLHPVVGGCLVIAMVFLFDAHDYLGLGVDARRSGGVCITSAFSTGDAAWWSWLAKLLFTVVTLGSGFKGGEVTPLFFVGATAGNAVATFMHVPVANIAAAGMTAVFAAASRCPIACILMGCELFGWQQIPLQMLICFGVFFMTRKKGIYDGALV